MNVPWCPAIIEKAKEIIANGGTQEDIDKLFNPPMDERVYDWDY